jgi:hypothetical protein
MGLSTEKHALVAYTGTAWFIQALPIEVCTLVHCLDGPDCMFPDPYESKVYSTEAVFDYISVEGLLSSRRHYVISRLQQARLRSLGRSSFPWCLPRRARCGSMQLFVVRRISSSCRSCRQTSSFLDPISFKAQVGLLSRARLLVHDPA